jgi:lipid-A-disaccharide synthase
VQIQFAGHGQLDRLSEGFGIHAAKMTRRRAVSSGLHRAPATGTLRPLQALTIMLVAGDPSGDLLATELARELACQAGPFGPRFIGAGGPAMAAAGVALRHDLTRHSVIGLEILRKYRELKAVFDDLVALALAERPEVIVGVDYGGFNLRLAEELRRRHAQERGIFLNWRPKIVQYVSPQVWASRPGRARTIAENHDLLLSILPFEAAWYARHAPRLRVEFVGHPIVDRHQAPPPEARETPIGRPTLLLLPGSRVGELQRHLPVMIPATERVVRETGCRVRIVLPREQLRAIAAPWLAAVPELEVQIGDLPAALTNATVALASTGTVTLECAWFGVPTVAIYRTSALTYAIGRRIVTVPFLAMPNLLAGEAIMPEFVQDAASPATLAGAVSELLQSPAKRATQQARLQEMVATLGRPGAARRAATAILEVVGAGR